VLSGDRGARGRWFLKLSRPGAIAPARAGFALRLAGALADLDVPAPRPRPTRSGKLWSRLEGFRAALFELVEGEPLGDHELRDPTLARQAAGPRDLEPDLVAFFLLRRNLDNLGDWVGARCSTAAGPS
jgi:hypothetical protein